MFAKKQKEAIEKSKMLDSKKGGQVPKIVIKKCTEIIKKLDHENKKHQILKSLFLIKINSTIKAPQPFKKTPTDIKSLQTLTSCRSTSLFSVTIKDFTFTPIVSKIAKTPTFDQIPWHFLFKTADYWFILSKTATPPP